jgi:hypothetical protein
MAKKRTADARKPETIIRELRAMVAKLAKRLRDSDHWPECAERQLIPNDVVDQVLAGKRPMPPTPPCICGKDALLAESKAVRS